MNELLQGVLLFQQVVGLDKIHVIPYVGQSPEIVNPISLLLSISATSQIRNLANFRLFFLHNYLVTIA